MRVRVEKRFYLVAGLDLGQSVVFTVPGKTFSQHLVQLGLGHSIPFNQGHLTLGPAATLSLTNSVFTLMHFIAPFQMIERM